MMSGTHRYVAFVDGGAPGLLKYGLHGELLSSDSEDTDYNPKSGDGGSSPADSNNDEIITVPKKRKTKRKVLRKQSRQLKRRKNDYFASSDSDDSDYIVEANQPKTRGMEKKITERAQQFDIEHPCPPRNDQWSTLPTEILALIFSRVLTLDKGVRYLSRSGRVCQHWYDTVSQSVAWQGIADLEFLGRNKSSNDTLIERLTESKFREIKGLNLCGWIHLTSTGVSCIAENCPKLEYLNLSNCQRNISKINGENIVQLAENTNLKRIDFSNLRICTGYAMSVGKFIKIRGEHLTHLNLSENISLGSAVVTNVSEHCANLIVLNLSNTSVRSICFIALQRTCSKLQELYLGNLSLEIKHSTNNDDNQGDEHNTGTENGGFPDLRILSVAKSQVTSWFTDSLIQSVLRTSRDLCTLDIRGNRSITFEGLNIPSNKVERLFISRTNISLQTAETISHKWNDVLWDLDMSWADAYGVNFDVLLKNLFEGVQPCLKIRNLNLAGTAVSDTGVECVLANCTSLECLDLTSCRGVARGNKRFHNGTKEVESLRNSYFSSEGQSAT